MTNFILDYHPKDLHYFGDGPKRRISFSSLNVFYGGESDSCHLSKILLSYSERFPAAFYYFRESHKSNKLYF